jgi:hypothetical protein
LRVRGWRRCRAMEAGVGQLERWDGHRLCPWRCRRCRCRCRRRRRRRCCRWPTQTIRSLLALVTGWGLAHGVISPTIAACGGVSPRSHLHHPYPSSTHPSHNLFVHSITSIPPSPSSSTAMATSRSALSALRLSARVCARPVIARSFQSARILRQGKAQSRDSC